jgi:hypothetical protein
MLKRKSVQWKNAVYPEIEYPGYEALESSLFIFGNSVPCHRLRRIGFLLRVTDGPRTSWT